MPIRQITIVGTGLIGGSLALALKKRKFSGRIIGCDRAPVLERAQEKGAIDAGITNPADAVQGSSVVVLATPVVAIVDLIERLGPALSAKSLLTDVGSTKGEVVARAQKIFGKAASQRFLAGHPMAGKEQSGVEFADPDLFHGAAWFVTPLPGQDIDSGLSGEFLEWVEKIGAPSIAGWSGDGVFASVLGQLLGVRSDRGAAAGLPGALFHCVMLSPITFIAVIAAWLRLA